MMNSILAIFFLLLLFSVYQFNVIAKMKKEMNELDDEFFEILIEKVSKKNSSE